MYFVECENKIKHILSVIHYTICGAECFQFTHFSCDDWENIYTFSYCHHQIGSMNYYPLFRVRSWNNGMRCMSFYILIEILWLIWCKHDMICDIIDMLWSMQYNRHNINDMTSFSSLLSLFNSGWSSEFGTRPTNGISIEFEIRSKFGVLGFEIFSTYNNEILHTSRQYHCRHVCNISL